jgi:ABC-type transport system substrate-binding protein
MEAIVGNDPSMYATPHGFFCPNTPMASTAGLDPLRGPRDYGKVKEMLKTAGYAGEKVVMVVATDYAQFKAIGDVAADMMTQSGMNVDYVATDWGTMLQRRNNKGPVDQGGWNCFFTGWEGLDHMNPSNHLQEVPQWAFVLLAALQACPRALAASLKRRGSAVWFVSVTTTGIPPPHERPPGPHPPPEQPHPGATGAAG